MAARDILPFSSALGGHSHVLSVLMDATANFDHGDVVVVSTNGDVVEAADEQSFAAVTGGIAAVASQSVANTRSSDGLLATAAANGEQIQFYGFDDLTEFVTQNLETADTAGPFGEAPTAAMVGDVGSLRVGSGVWGLCTNASSSNLEFIITRVLDSQFEDVTKSGGTGVYVVFKKLA